MHEFSLIDAVIQQLTKVTDLAKVEEIILEIGKLASVDIESLNFWFPVALRKTIADAKIKLTINSVDGLAKCNHCLEQFHIDNLYQACPKCNGYGNYTLLHGRELLIKSYRLS